MTGSTSWAWIVQLSTWIILNINKSQRDDTQISESEINDKTKNIKNEIKAELGKDYQDILSYTTQQVNQYQNTFRNNATILITTATVIVGFIARFFQQHISWILNKVKALADSTEVLSNSINLKLEELDQTKKNIEELQEKINNQWEKINKNVLQKLADGRFKRISIDPKEINNLFGILATIDKEFINEIHFNNLLEWLHRAHKNTRGSSKNEYGNISMLIRQHFPVEGFRQDDIEWSYSGILSGAYPIEIRENTQLLVSVLSKTNSKVYLNNLVKYFEAIYSNLYNAYSDNLTFFESIEPNLIKLNKWISKAERTKKEEERMKQITAEQSIGLQAQESKNNISESTTQ